MQLEKMSPGDLAEFRQRRARLEIEAILNDAFRRVGELVPRASRIKRRPLTEDLLQAVLAAMDESDFDASPLTDLIEERDDRRKTVIDVIAQLKKLQSDADACDKLEGVIYDLDDLL